MCPHSRLQFEQGDVSTVGSQHQFLQAPPLSGCFSRSLGVDAEHHHVCSRPFGPAQQTLSAVVLSHDLNAFTLN